MRRSSKAIAVKSSSCSAICAATPPLPRPPSLRKSSTFCANTTVRSGRSSLSSRGRWISFSGDGIMVFFNDPVPIPDPAERAVNMAVAMREAASSLIAAWRRRDRDLGFGVGIAQGHATLGQIGFAERSGYTAIGTVCNLAARLCAEAKDGQILISGRVAAAVETVTPLEDLGSPTVKGLTQPVSAFNVPLAASQPAFRVIEGGPQSA